MKFALILSAVSAINIGNLPGDTSTTDCQGLGEDHAPTVTTKCADLTTGTPFSVQEWKDLRHHTSANCYKVIEGPDAVHFGAVVANCVK